MVYSTDWALLVSGLAGRAPPHTILPCSQELLLLHAEAPIARSSPTFVPPTHALPLPGSYSDHPQQNVTELVSVQPRYAIVNAIVMCPRELWLGR
ncbi:hypothetical protein OF83DRAFT_642123 [Amylostereum chailletii]|nr:hypothetical protein OF83DRAFT_642123 [Amylostereum chailletii]